ncbi:hypothetical protein O3P69_002484 [Scylla paramamosain]|uniref:Uncharacterized protein n=1 Tax=Scylla paramamosain TaxID=85552 RepID=A0AAW0UPD3_SCYPA
MTWRREGTGWLGEALVRALTQHKSGEFRPWVNRKCRAGATWSGRCQPVRNDAFGPVLRKDYKVRVRKSERQRIGEKASNRV